MALADILTRIDADSSDETEAIISAATERAEQIAIDAETRAAAHSAEVAATAESSATREADTIVVNARLAARDAEVTARRQLLDEALSAAAEALAALPDAEYAHFLARRIVEAARGGETLLLGSADTGRKATVTAEVVRIAPGLKLTVAEEPAPFERGAMLQGQRVRADLSLPAIIAEHRDDLELEVARVLFDEEA